MDSGGQYENRRCNPDYYKGAHSMWNMLPQHQIKEQHNALVMNKKIMAILAERDAALQERNEALSSKGEALAARDEALQERDKALAERDNALMERNSALSALHFRENSTFHSSLTCKSVYADETNMPERYSSLEMAPSATIKSKQTKKRKENIKSEQSKGKKVGEDLNRQVASPGKKCKKEWDSYDVGLNLVNFDETTMLVPVCSCTGTAHQCYKWGSGGWQSSCCTTTLSMHPLPQMPNKRHSRMGGRKMSGSVFTKLLSRLAAEGHNLSVPVDLRNYWARHGTNRYITIK